MNDSFPTQRFMRTVAVLAAAVLIAAAIAAAVILISNGGQSAADWANQTCAGHGGVDPAGWDGGYDVVCKDGWAASG